MSFQNEIGDAFGVIAPLLASKNEAYGASWEHDGLNGLLIRLGDKLRRARHLLSQNASCIAGESLADTVLDILGYAVIAYIATHRGNLWGNK